FGALFRDAYRIDARESLDAARSKLDEGMRALGAEAEIAAIAPVLSYLVGIDGDAPPETDPEALRLKILLAARLLVERRLEQGPLLMIIEDAHFADAASLELLRDIADRLVERPLMVLLAQRPPDTLPAPVHAAAVTIELTPLQPQAIESLVAALFGANGD